MVDRDINRARPELLSDLRRGTTVAASAVVLPILLFVLGWSAVTNIAVGGERLAFLLGTDKYEHLPSYRQLTRSIEDARAMAVALQQLGYAVETWEDQSRSGFNARWQDFLEKIQPEDTVVLFLSGHGVDIEGQNYLLPSDVPYISFGRQEQLKRESISISELLLDLRTGREPPRVTVLIVDACRENPFVPAEYKSGQGAGGLASMEPPEGTFVMYSAAANETALDRLPGSDDDRNSVYVRKLLPLLRESALPLPDLAQELRRQVRDLTRQFDHLQRPAYYDSLIVRFCFTGCATEIRVGGLALPDDASTAWEWIENTESADALVTFEAAFRETRYAELARRRLDLLAKKESRLYVLAIGVGRYEDAAITELASAAYEAQEVARLLSERMGPEFADAEVQVLTDSSATRRNILERLSQIRHRARPNDTTVIYLSGHAVPKGDELYLVPFDARQGGQETFISFTEIQRYAGETLGQRVLLVDSMGLSRKLEEALLADLRAEQVAVLLAVSPGQVAPAESVFTPAIIRGLLGAADIEGRGSISFSDSGVMSSRRFRRPQVGSSALCTM